jgi:arylsulfatase A-like enzyme
VRPHPDPADSSRTVATAAPAIVRIAFALAVAVPLILAPAYPRSQGTADAEGSLNLLLVTVDTFRPDHSGVYGYHRDTTPTLDEFAADAAVFPNAFAVSAWTFPGVVSILTGVYPPTHGYDARGRTINEEAVPLQAHMRDAGYRVPAISYVSGIPGIAALQVESSPEWPPRELRGRRGWRILYWLGTDEAREEQPFFAWYHYRAVHLPYKPLAPNDTLYGDAPVTPGIQQVLDHSVIPAELQNFMPEERSSIIDLYDGELRDFDDFWANLIATLEDNGLLDRTLIVVTADHGEELFEHGLLGHASTTTHATLYDEVLRIPLIVRMPGENLEAPTCQVSQVDVMPTVLGLLGLSIPAGTEGRDLSRALRGEAECREGPVFAESILGGFQARGESARTFVWAVRTPEWKLIRRENLAGEQAHELYALSSDPGELNDLYSETAGLQAGEQDAADRLGLLLDEYFSNYDGPDYWHRPVEVAPPAPRAATEVAAPPRILSPLPGSRLGFDESGATLAGEWTGSPTASYVVEYDVGVDHLRTSGQIHVVGTRLEFGPAPIDIWNSLAQFNPWRFRVWPEGASDKKSEWIEFEIEAGDGQDR